MKNSLKKQILSEVEENLKEIEEEIKERGETLESIQLDYTEEEEQIECVEGEVVEEKGPVVYYVDDDESEEETYEVEVNSPTKRSFLPKVIKKAAIGVAAAVVLSSTPVSSILTEPTAIVAEASTKDTTKPKFKFSGKTTVTVEKNQSIKIPKVTAKDNKDGNITKKITITVKKGKKAFSALAKKIKQNKKVKFTSTGKYTITYTVKDKAGNKATKKRYIKVVNPTNKTNTQEETNVT